MGIDPHRLRCRRTDAIATATLRRYRPVVHPRPPRPCRIRPVCDGNTFRSADHMPARYAMTSASGSTPPAAPARARSRAPLGRRVVRTPTSVSAAAASAATMGSCRKSRCGAASSAACEATPAANAAAGEGATAPIANPNTRCVPPDATTQPSQRGSIPHATRARDARPADERRTAPSSRHAFCLCWP